MDVLDGDIIKILLVQPYIMPPTGNFFYNIFYRKFGSITFIRDFYQMLLQLGAVTPDKYSVKLIDERFEKIDYDETCDLIFISIPTDYATRAYEIADEFRKREKIVAVGDYHATVLPNEAKQHADSVLIGEVELTWPQLLEDFEKGKLKPFYKQETLINPKFILPARRELVKKYHRILARVQATRGCPVGCEFCRIPVMEGTELRKRPIEDVIKEIESIPQKLIFFSDGSLTLDPEYTKSLFRGMKKLHKRFFCTGNVDVLAKDDEFLKLAKAAGCMMWYVGLESVNQKTIDILGKKTNVVEKYAAMVNKIHRYGMAVSGSFILGFDNDTLEDFDSMLNAFYDLKLDSVELNILTPFPGTALFERLDQEKRILTKDWFHYREGQGGTIVVFKPRDMSPDELKKEIATRVFCKWYGGKNTNQKEFRITKMRLMKEGLKIGFYPFIFRSVGFFFHL